MDLAERDLLKRALDWQSSGRGVAICTVLETWGSAPNPVGSHLIVDADGSFIGSVSGGCVEGDVVVEAIDVIETKQARLLEFGVSDETAWKATLTCGGRVRIYVEPLDEHLTACLTRFIRERAASRSAVLITALDGRPTEVVAPGDTNSALLTPQIENVFRTNKSALVRHGNEEYFLTALTLSSRLLVVGAVHIAQALAPMAKLAGMEMSVIDPRSAFATAERFPGVHMMADWPSNVAETVGFSKEDAVAVLSHDPKIDDPALRLALAAGCFYVGALGSRRSHAQRLERLRAAGVSEQELQRIRGPIGLGIGAEGPAEIAVSIMAEIIATRRGMSLCSSAAAGVMAQS